MIKDFQILFGNCYYNLQNETAQNILIEHTDKIVQLKNRPDKICAMWKVFLVIVNKGININSETINKVTDAFNEIFITDYPHHDSETETLKDYIINMCMSGDSLRGYEMRNEYAGFVKG